MDVSDNDVIKLGQYIIIQRQEYTKLHKFGSVTSNASLGKDQVELANIINCKYYTTFKMIQKGKGRNRVYTLEVADDSITNLKDNLNSAVSGKDNRNITDDGLSQKLTTDEILALRDSSLGSNDIVTTLVSNSTSFNSKTEYSQEKYLKKKQKKYYEFLQIRKPTIRLIADIMYRQDPVKVLGVRSDTLSQLLAYSNVCSYGNYLLYDSGTNGLLSAAILNSIGRNTEGRLIHMHPGNSPQKQALLAMNFEEEHFNRYLSVNLYSVLRHYYQNKLSNNDDPQIDLKSIEKLEEITVKDLNSIQEKQADTGMSAELDNIADSNSKRKRSISNDNGDENSIKMQKVDSNLDCSKSTNDTVPNDENVLQKIPRWEIENEKASCMLREKVDALVIVAKEHPFNLFKCLSPFVGSSKPFVIFHNYQEPLQECYIAMRKLNNVTGVKLTNSWTRGYQVLPNRTHPDVLMQGNSGYLLTGWIVQ